MGAFNPGHSILHGNHNRNRQKRINANKTVLPSPWEKAHKMEWKYKLVPFGIGARVVLDTLRRSQKFEDRTFVGTVIGYGPRDALRIIDAKKEDD